MGMKWIKLDAAFEFIRNGVNIKQTDGVGGYPITRIETIANGYVDKNKMGYAGIDEIAKYQGYVLQYGDILMSHINSEKHLGKSAVYLDDTDIVIHGMNLLGLRCKKELLDSKYAYYYFNSAFFKRKIPKITKKSVNQASFSLTDVKQLEIAIPVMLIQKKIVNVLDKAQELIDKRKEQIAACDELIKSLFYHMFGDPINSKKYKYERMKNVVVKLTDGTHKSPPNINNGIPYITAKHLGSGRLNFYTSPTYISVEEHEKIFSRCNPAYGDVLYIKDGATTGIAAINIYDFEFSMLSSLALIKTKKYMLSEIYLVNYLNNERVKNTILQDMAGGAIKRLTLNKINQISIMLPPIDLQKDFAKKVEKIELQKQLLTQSLTELENNFNSLMQRAFKGELF